METDVVVQRVSDGLQQTLRRISSLAGGLAVMATFISAFHKVEAGGKITFKCGASEIVVDDSGVAITSPMVMILAGKIQIPKATTEV